MSRDKTPRAPAKGLPVVAIVGRPNAGKSTLFNRLTHSRRALVDEMPGVTRDRNIAEAVLEGRRFLLIDTGGIEAGPTAGIDAEVRAQSDLALDEADAVIVLVDGRAGVSSADRDVLSRLRRAGRPLWVAVNKLDTPTLEDDAVDFFALGVDHVVPISAAHGHGVSQLMSDILDAVAPEPADDGEPPPEESSGAVAVAIVGRPNVGKSSLVNRLLGYERSIVAAVPGTTRDAIDTPFSQGGRNYVLVDTAGIRRRPRVRVHLERASVVRALRALDRSEVAVLVVDASEGMTDQDARIAGYAWERGRGLIIAVNKCDLRGGIRKTEKALLEEIPRLYPFLADVPIVFLSAQRGEGVETLLPGLQQVADNHRRELQTSHLNDVVMGAVQSTAPPSVNGRRPTFKYAVQTGTKPPIIVIFCSRPELVAEAYTRYIGNRLREAFAFSGTPIWIRYRGRPPSEQARTKQQGRRSRVRR